MTLEELFKVLDMGARCVIWNDEGKTNEPPIITGRAFECQREKDLLEKEVKQIVPSEMYRIDIFIKL